MKTLKPIAFTLSLSLLAATPVFASPSGSYPERGSVPHTRAMHPRQSGEQERYPSRPAERAMLREQREIRELARNFFEDGRLTKREHQILEYRLAKAGGQHRIFKHDELTRYLKLHDEYGHH
jgi:hypothetical protein